MTTTKNLPIQVSNQKPRADIIKPPLLPLYRSNPFISINIINGATQILWTPPVSSFDTRSSLHLSHPSYAPFVIRTDNIDLKWHADICLLSSTNSESMRALSWFKSFSSPPFKTPTSSLLYPPPSARFVYAYARWTFWRNFGYYVIENIGLLTFHCG